MDYRSLNPIHKTAGAGVSDPVFKSEPGQPWCPEWPGNVALQSLGGTFAPSETECVVIDPMSCLDNESPM